MTSEEMLSSAARRNLERTQMEFGIPAGLGMTYEIVSTEMFGRSGAQVECRFMEESPGATGGPENVTSQSCCWVLRQEPVRGWRVTGAIVPAIPGMEPILLDFENMEETLRKIAAVQRELEDGISIR